MAELDPGDVRWTSVGVEATEELDQEAGPLLRQGKGHAGPEYKQAPRMLAVMGLLLAVTLIIIALLPEEGAKDSTAPATAFGRYRGRPLQSLVEVKPNYIVEQEDATFSEGKAIKVYAVGSSNTVWVPWVEQLHLLLGRLGYQLPLVPVAGLTRPTEVPVCEDADEYASLETVRVGEPGWGSWGFAYEGREGCGVDGYRQVAGKPVSCRPAWGCPADSPEPLSLSHIAAAASSSDVTVLSCWINDSKQFATGNSCYNHTNVSRVDTAAISIETLRRMIRSIHQHNPNVWVVVLALYPDAHGPPQTVNEETLPMIVEINRRVRQGLLDEPKTLFADYSFPLGVKLFQTLHFGHPNCRASKLMANAVVDTLYNAGLISRGFAVREQKACPTGPKVPCAALDLACCQRSALCRVLAGSACVPYGPGS